MKNISDNELVDRLLANDQAVILFFFYQKYWNNFRYHIYKIFPYSVEVQALVHEFFLYLYENDWKRMRTFSAEVAGLNTWISVVSYRFFKKYKDSMMDSNGMITTKENWDKECDKWEVTTDQSLKMDIRKAIDEIHNERDRQIAVRLLLDEDSSKEVAADFQLSVDYLYTVKNRIIKSLRKKLKAYYE